MLNMRDLIYMIVFIVLLLPPSCIQFGDGWAPERSIFQSIVRIIDKAAK